MKRGRGRRRQGGEEGQRERNIYMRETLTVASYMGPDWGQGSNLQPSYTLLAGNRTQDPEVNRLML